jgi:hypothetical protein
MSDDGTLTYETGWDPSAGSPAVLLTGVTYCWWLMIGGVFEILFGGIYLGGEEAKFHVSAPELNLIYVLTGVFMLALSLGILRLQRWVWWGAWLMALVLIGLSVDEIVRRINGTPLTNETVFFSALALIFCAYTVYFLSAAGSRDALHYRLFKGSPFSPGMALCAIALATPTLAVTLFVNHINKHLNTPVLLLVYLLGFVLMIVMAFMGLKLKRWVWWGCWGWAIVLTWLSIDVIIRQATATHVESEAIIFSAVNFLVVAVVVYYLVLDDVREAVFRDRPKQTIFSPPTLIGGLLLSVLALAIYLLSDDLGQLPVTYSVFGMVMGVVVALLPGADPTNRLMGFVVGLLLAFASFVVRGGLLPYTKLSAAIVVTLMLLIITGITALIRSRTWFVAMLLGAGTMYGLVEPLFQAAPSGYLAAAGLAFAGILLGFGVGYAVSGFLQLELVPYATGEAGSSPALASQSTGSGTTSGSASHDDQHAKATTGPGATSGKAGHDAKREKATSNKPAGATNDPATTSDKSGHDDTPEKGSTR